MGPSETLRTYSVINQFQMTQRRRGRRVTTRDAPSYAKHLMNFTQLSLMSIVHHALKSIGWCLFGHSELKLRPFLLTIIERGFPIIGQSSMGILWQQLSLAAHCLHCTAALPHNWTVSSSTKNDYVYQYQPKMQMSCCWTIGHHKKYLVHQDQYPNTKTIPSVWRQMVHRVCQTARWE